MSGKSKDMADRVLNTQKATALSAWTPYVGLFNTNPADDNSTGTEVTGNAYQRQSVTWGSITGTDTSSMSNSADILFPVQTPGNYGTVNGVGIWDAVSAGVLKYWVSITGVTFATGNQAKFAAGALTCTES